MHAQPYPDFLCLSNRSKELHDAHGVMYPDPREGVLNTAQTDVSLGLNFCPCVVPHGEYWVMHRGRTFAGREPLNMQSIFVTADVSSRFSESFMLDIGGNAFSALSGSLSFSILLCGLAQMWSSSVLRSTIPPNVQHACAAEAQLIAKHSRGRNAKVQVLCALLEYDGDDSGVGECDLLDRLLQPKRRRGNARTNDTCAWTPNSVVHTS